MNNKKESNVSDIQSLLVRKKIEVHAPREHTFQVFTERFDLWWPRSHHIGKTDTFKAMLEPKLGGRWFEKGDDGSECDWGRVLAWEPPARLVLSWNINAQWQSDPSIANEVEVLFTQLGEHTTLVELEHRRLERYGDDALMMRNVFDSEGGWTGILVSMARFAENPSSTVKR